MMHAAWTLDLMTLVLAQVKKSGDIEFSALLRWFGIIVGAIFAFAVLGFFLAFGKLWLQALSSGSPVRVMEFVGMYLRKVNPRVIIDVLVMTHKAGIPVHVDKLQAHVLARGNVRDVVQALVAASRANIKLSFERAAAIDLAGRDVLDAVRTSVHPKVIDCPNPARGRPTIDAVAKNGIQLRIKARVTVRTNIERLVGGATEETVIARVGEGIVAAVGQADTHKDVLANPRQISREVLNSGLDAGTAFDIVSIDIADVDVGENIGAKLMADQAEAEKRRAQAEAEAQRARAVARGQEMEALGKENRAKVILAEAEIPLAMAEAFRSGNLGIMDYYNLQNIKADTRMRSTIAEGASGTTGGDSEGS
ncbi:MAG TPA: flotillin-like protein FloA, partial [Planctomycetota bacterium]|nr:flotillin-like protein FloA [Planctomycetota bacterium]